MGCRSTLARLSMGVETRRLQGVEGTLGLWALRWALLDSCCEEKVETIMVYGSSMSILQDENGASVASAVRGAIACTAFTAANIFLDVWR